MRLLEKKITNSALFVAVILSISGCAMAQSNIIHERKIEEKASSYEINNEKEKIADLTETWANALKSRDGKPRYEMMSEKAKEKFIQEQIDRSGEDWNFNIGDSSPWVVDYEIEIKDMTSVIRYATQTSESTYHNLSEPLTFGWENGNLVVVDYQSNYEDDTER